MPAFLAVPLAALAVLLFLVALPITGPLLAASLARGKRRQRLAAEETRCVRCGHRLGLAALEAGDAAWAAEVEELRRRYPHHLLRLVRRVHAVCTACGTAYEWGDSDKAFHPRPAEAVTDKGER